MTGRWWLRAACRGKPLDWWFPERGIHFETQVARNICARCPVRAVCLHEALLEELVTETIPVGIRGGTSGEQRTVMLRTMRRAEVTAT